jgi:hypothetical protein
MPGIAITVLPHFIYRYEQRITVHKRFRRMQIFLRVTVDDLANYAEFILKPFFGEE